MIEVLITNDSPAVRDYLYHILSADPALSVVGVVKNGQEAITFVQWHRPDVVVMDIVMPYMDGFEATRRIMETVPVPVVIVSGSSGPEETIKTFRALEAGALAVVKTPPGLSAPDATQAAKTLVDMVKLMSEVKVVRRWPRVHQAETLLSAGPQVRPRHPSGGIDLVAIGASTGGPAVLHTILSGLAKDLPVPLCIVQHIAPGFLPGMVAWLGQATGFPTRAATHGEPFLPGHAYLAPDGFHMGVSRDGRIILSHEAPEDGQRPAVSYLFRSVAQGFGARAVGVLLTGMGRDGATALKYMKDQGAVTIVQDRDSAVVHGMAGEALRLDAATYVLPPQEIAAALTQLVNNP